MPAAKPVLWQIKISLYSEKVRWALDYKAVEHERRSPPPPAHMAISAMKTRGASKTFPLLELDGRSYGDSTEIVAALEERFPEPPLYPADPEARARALALEDFFDEEVGEYTRRLAWHEVVRHRPTLETLVANELAGPHKAGTALASRLVGAFVGLRYGVNSDAGAEEARRKIEAGLDRLEAELGGREYLVGDSFSVADLAAASMYYPIVLPAEGPSIPAAPPAYAEYRASLADRAGYSWVAEMFRRHRRRGAARPAATA